ncbi:52 kDa repressor of the inhibitor of the protein kinase-like, partial [Aphis craccivora]
MNPSNTSKNYIKCAYSNCQNKMAQNPNVSYFSLPKDPTNRVKWIENCGITIPDAFHKKSLKVCGEHFDKIMFLNDLHNRLHSHAIPRHFI